MRAPRGRGGQESAPQGDAGSREDGESRGGALTTWRISLYSRARKSRVTQRGKALSPPVEICCARNPSYSPEQTSIRLQRWFSLNSKPVPLWPTWGEPPWGDAPEAEQGVLAGSLKTRAGLLVSAFLFPVRFQKAVP